MSLFASDRHGFLMCAWTFMATVATSASLASEAPNEATRPNMVVILVDDVRADDLGVTGHPFVDTPNIDELAAEGVLFGNGFVTTPLCSPSRASFLTGRYARTHGVIRNSDPDGVSHLLTTFPRILERSGYDTAFIGKWHLGEDDAPNFTHWISFAGQGRYENPELNINGRRVTASGHLTDLLVGYADDFVRTAARGFRPFLLYLSHKAVHEPGEPPRRYLGSYNGAPVPCSPGCDDTLEGKPALTRSVPGTVPPAPGQGPADSNIRSRHRRIRAVDDGVGRLRRTLEEEGILDETMIVFTSDNGYFHREHGLGDKRWAYEEALRIPFLVRYPPLIRANTQIGLLVLNIDLAPTLLDLAGVPVPANVHGRSLLPLFRDIESPWRGGFVAEHFPQTLFPRVPRWEAIRTGRFKYIRYPDLGREFDEFYDLQADPFELKNLALDPSAAHRRESLSGQLEKGFEDLAQ